MSVRLLVDPASNRLVYLSVNGVLPERVFILDGAGPQLFTPRLCRTVEFAGELPRGLHPQNCWSYRLTPTGALERAG